MQLTNQNIKMNLEEIRFSPSLRPTYQKQGQKGGVEWVMEFNIV